MILLTVGAAFSFASAHGQQIAWSQFIWTAWENAAVAKRGPDVSEGLLLYFHGFDPSGADGERIEEIFIQMARLARWDILRINRVPFVDEASQDEELLRYVDQQVVKARNEGYRRIIAAGSSRGGWLALSAASLDGVDGAIGLAPGTDDFTPELLEWQRAELARRLGRARAKRIAVAFFEGDELENTKEPRALAVRPALASTFAAFMIIDRPAGLLGHAAPVSGRFIRRYRDCLLDLMRAIDPRPGETECSQTEGYAVGSDIGFRDFAQLTSSPGNPFSPYLARWQGDDEAGGYVIMQPAKLYADHVIFRFGQSPSPYTKTVPWVRDIPFRLGDGALVHEQDKWPVRLVGRLRSHDELELEAFLLPSRPPRRYLLRRH